MAANAFCSGLSDFPLGAQATMGGNIHNRDAPSKQLEKTALEH